MSSVTLLVRVHLATCGLSRSSTCGGLAYGVYASPDPLAHEPRTMTLLQPRRAEAVVAPPSSFSRSKVHESAVPLVLLPPGASLRTRHPLHADLPSQPLLPTHSFPGHRDAQTVHAARSKVRGYFCAEVVDVIGHTTCHWWPRANTFTVCFVASSCDLVSVVDP